VDSFVLGLIKAIIINIIIIIMMVLRLPPYRCKLNPIELVWDFIKTGVATNNSTYNKFSDVKILFQHALTKVLPEHSKNDVTHVQKEEKCGL
jgi:transposase